MKFRKQERFDANNEHREGTFYIPLCQNYSYNDKIIFSLLNPYSKRLPSQKVVFFWYSLASYLSIINSISHRVQKKRPYKQFCLEINLLITYEQQHLSTAK